MNDRVKALARDLGADFVAELPDVGHGVLGAAHYAAYYGRRLQEIKQQEDSGQILHLPLKRFLSDVLDQIVTAMSEEGHQVTRADVALLLLCDATERALDSWAAAHDDPNEINEVDRRKNQIEKAKAVLCESLGLTPPKRSAAG